MIKGHMKFWISTILLFFLIYSSPISFLPGFLTTTRIATLGLILLFLIVRVPVYIVKQKTRLVSYKSFVNTYKFILLLFLYSLIVVTFIGTGTGESILPVFVNMFISSFIPTIILIRLYDSADSFLKSILWVTIFQTVIIWLCLLIPSFQSVVDSVFLYNADHEDFRVGYAGGIACITAPGAIKYCLGLISCVYFYVEKNQNKFIFLLILFSVTATMIARTGLLLSAIALIFIIFEIIRKVRWSRIIGFCIILIASVFVLLSVAGKYEDFVLERFARLSFLFEVGLNEAFLTAYFDGATTVIPPISAKTLLGTGVYSGLSGNNVYVNADGGFIKNYVAIGLIPAVVFYLYFFLKSFILIPHLHVRTHRLLIIMFLIMIALAEFKEYIILDMYMLTVFYTLTVLLQNDETNQIIKI